MSKIMALFFLLAILIPVSARQAAHTIPFRFVRNKYIFIDIKVDNSRTLTFFFDTGATTTLIDSTAAAVLGIHSNRSQQVEGAGGNASYQTTQARKICAIDVTLENIPMVIKNLSALEERMEYDFDGIIGYPFMESFITEVNFDESVIRLYEPANFRLPEDYSAHLFTLSDDVRIPALTTLIELENGEMYNGRVLFDSGASLTLLVNTPFQKEHHLMEQFDKKVESQSASLTKSSVNTKADIYRLMFCGYSFSKLPIFISSDTKGVSSWPGYLGILGIKIIYRFNFILDYKQQRLFLKPNRFFNDTFASD